MRKWQQKQILEIIKTLEEAQSVGLYADAQDGALAIGEFIEQIKGEGTKTVELLTEYCELLFKASQGEVGEKLLKKYLIKVDNSIRTELRPSKIEIVFICYNASMSDSVLPIYQAAKADPNCEAVWLPVPFYERKSDGSLGVMHYEGAEHYPNIECADWKEYDIEAHHPDIIVTYNPYDEGNFVTSIHPAFYTKRLRDLTDLLLYIPYFVVMDDVPEHFATVAGCVYAHKVIVQSEKICASYIRAFKQEYGNNFGNPKNKFMALGSPKFEVAVNSKREDYELPVEWKKMISNTDGGSKKILLYNARLTDMTAGIENQIAKLKNVLAYFKTRTDILLWFRPHPLNLETMKSMRPQFAVEYAQIIEDYKYEAWGIYDDSSDLHRAIAWTDAYYGDRSSVAALYEATGKAVLILDVGKKTSTSEMNLIIENIFDDGNDLWCTPFNFNSLFKISKTDWNLEHVAFLPDEKYSVWRHSISIINAGNRLFFVPFAANNLIEYDKGENKFYEYSIDLNDEIIVDRKIQIEHNKKFIQAFSNEEYIFIIPFTYPCIIRFNIKTKEMILLSDWVEELERHITVLNRGYFRYGVVVDGKIMLACTSANAVFEFDMNTCKHRIHLLNNKYLGYHSICFDGNDYWLAPMMNSSIIKWNAGSGAIEVVSEGSQNIIGINEADTYPYQSIDFLNSNKILALPAYAKYATIIDIEKDTVLNADEFLPECELELLSEQMIKSNFIMQENINGLIYAFSARTNCLIVYNPVSEELHRKKLTLSAHDCLKVLKKLYCSRNELAKVNGSSILYENTIRLIDFVDCVVDDAETYADEQNGLNIGKSIYSFVKQEVFHL